MYKVLNENTPKYLQEQFNNLKTSIPYNLRNADIDLAFLKPNSEYLKKSFGYNGATAWSTLPKYIGNSTNLT